MTSGRLKIWSKWYGKYSKTDGSKYEGEWRNDCQHGAGFETWVNGQTYKGDFVEGRKEGFGI